MRPHGIAFVALIFAITAGTAALAGSSRTSREPERISVTAVSGTVSVTMAGSATPVQPDATVSLPAHIVTGDDGMLSLTQAGTNITIAADSDVEIPAEASDGELIARLVQRRGNVFYDVAHREVGTLRVETPFLVAVIKGTQFNVAVQESSSTISLFQGRLDIRTPDGSNSVILNAGQIASRSSAGEAIRVIGMNDVRLEAPRTGDAVARNAAASNDAIQPRVFAMPAGVRDMPAGAPQARIESASSATDVDLGAAGSVGRSLYVGTGNPGAGGVPGSLGVNAGLGAGGVPASLGVNAGLGAGGAPVSVGANLNVGTGSSGISVGAGAEVGAGGVPASVGANLNVGTGSSGVSLGAGAGVGGVSATVGANVNAGSSGVSLGAGAGVGTGGLPATIGANLNVGTSSPGVSLGAGAGVGTGGLPATVGANLNVGAGSSGVSLGAGTGVGAGAGVGAGVSLGSTVTVDIGLGNTGLHLGTGGSIDDNHGLHLGNSGKPGFPGKSKGHP